MPLVRRIQSRGATMTVVANGEVLFMPGGDLPNWKRRFSNNVRRFAAEAAPSNKRPRWGHYGEPLKKTFTSSTDIDTAAMKIHTAIGSTAPYSAFVDQGTNDFYAKILPPWQRQSPSLYEHTWKVPVRAGTDEQGRSIIEFEELGRIRVRGQRARQFMADGIKRAFAAQRMDQQFVPIDGEISAARDFFPTRLANFVGATPRDSAFLASLAEWRAWRDAAWERGDVLGLGINRERTRREYRRVLDDIREETDRAARRARERANSRERSSRYRERQRAKNPRQRKPRLNPGELTRAADRARVLALAKKQFGDDVFGEPYYENGVWVVTVRSGRGFKVYRIKAKSRPVASDADG